MQQGIVKTWDDLKGFGFISLDSGQEIFSHFTAIPQSNPRRRRALVVGEPVSVEVSVRDDGRTFAHRVIRLFAEEGQ